MKAHGVDGSPATGYGVRDRTVGVSGLHHDPRERLKLVADDVHVGPVEKSPYPQGRIAGEPRVRHLTAIRFIRLADIVVVDADEVKDRVCEIAGDGVHLVHVEFWRQNSDVPVLRVDDVAPGLRDASGRSRRVRAHDVAGVCRVGYARREGRRKGYARRPFVDGGGVMRGDGAREVFRLEKCADRDRDAGDSVVVRHAPAKYGRYVPLFADVGRFVQGSAGSDAVAVIRGRHCRQSENANV